MQLTRWLLASAALALSACGGGGGDAPLAQPAAAEPTAQALAVRAPAAPRTALDETRLTPPPAMAAPVTRIYYLGELGRRVNLQVTYRGDGTARVVNQQGWRDATWAYVAGYTTVTLNTPFSTVGYTAELIGGQQQQVSHDLTGYRFKQLLGQSGSTNVQYGAATRQRMLTGPTAGTIVDYGWSTNLVRVAVENTLPLLSADMFPTGQRFGGVVSALDAAGNPEVDVMQITGPGSALLERSGALLEWRVAAGRLVLKGAMGEFSYAAMVNPGPGPTHTELTQVTELQAGQPVRAFELHVAGVDPEPAFPPDGRLFKRWESGLSAGFFIELAADGTGKQISISNGVESASPLTWTLGADGHLRMLRASGAVREWQLLSRPGDGSTMTVLERLTQNGAPLVAWRLNTWSPAASTTAPLALGQMGYYYGEAYPLRVSLTLNPQSGQVIGGSWDFHKIAGTMTPCTATPENTGPNGNCVGVNAGFTSVTQSAALSAGGVVGPVSLVGSHAEAGFTFTGTVVGKVWSGTWVKVPTPLVGGSQSGSFSVELGFTP